MRDHRAVIVAFAALAIAGCQNPPEHRRGSPSRGKPYSCAEHLPETSAGRKPAGTKEDPFVGYGVLRIKRDYSPELAEVLVRQRAIPYFRRGVEWWVYVPREAATDVSDGDFVRLKYARVPEDSEIGRRALEAERTGVSTGPMPFVYCGHQLFAIERVPDAEFPR